MAAVAMAQRNTAEALQILDAEEKTEGHNSRTLRSSLYTAHSC
jgi:hypothetical protein